MNERHDYRCTQCGELLFRARGTSPAVDIEIKCRERRCRSLIHLPMGAPQAVNEAMRQRWAALRRQWFSGPPRLDTERSVLGSA